MRNHFHQTAAPSSSSFINQQLREIISTRQRLHHYHSSTNIWEKSFPPGSSPIIIIHQPTFERNYFNQAVVLSLSFINQHLREIIATRQCFYHKIIHQPTFERNYFNQAVVPSSSFINKHLREIIATRQWFYHYYSSINICEKLLPPGSGSIIKSFNNQHLREIILTMQRFHHYHSSTNIWEKSFPPGSGSSIIIHQPTIEWNYFHQAEVLSSSFINQHLRNYFHQAAVLLSTFIIQHLREILSIRQHFHYHSSTDIWEKLFPPGSSSTIIIHQPTFERNYFNQAAVPSSSFINQHLIEIISTRQQFHHHHSTTNIWEKLFQPGSVSIIIIHQPTLERNCFHQAAVPLSFINQHFREIISTRQWFHHYHSSTNIREILFPPDSRSIIIIYQPTFERNYFHQAAVPSLYDARHPISNSWVSTNTEFRIEVILSIRHNTRKKEGPWSPWLSPEAWFSMRLVKKIINFLALNAILFSATVDAALLEGTLRFIDVKWYWIWPGVQKEMFKDFIS